MNLRIRLAAVAVLAAVLALNGVATLYAAATAPTIHACVGPKGAMTYAPNGKCPKGQTALTWNVTGPQGATGPAGSGGSTGGASAPTAYTSKWTDTKSPFSPAVWWDLTSVTLPAGTYDVRVFGWMTSSGGGTSKSPATTTYRCAMLSFTWTVDYFGSSFQRTIALEDVATLAEPGRLAFRCMLDGYGEGTSPATASAFMIATPVALP